MRVSTVTKNTARLLLAVIIGLALVSSLSTIAQAQDPVDLELGGGGATSWDIGNIKPGDSGTKTVALHNAGYNDGFVTIWISDIVNSEGANPEAETGDTTEPGELGDYLVFDLTRNGINTNLSLPATIANLPQSASDPNYIRISPLEAGDTVDLSWEWELPPQTGNDAQGDGLSFTINYLLEEFPTPPPAGSGGGGGGGGGSTSYLQVDMLGKITRLEMKTDGTITESHLVTDSSGGLILEIDRDTKVITSGGMVPKRVVVTLAEELPTAPDDMAIVGPVYNITAYLYGTVGYPVKFEPPVRFTLSYDPDELPENTSSVFIGSYDDEQGFAQLASPVGYVAEVGEAKAEVSHLTSFAVMCELAPPPPPAPANFEVSNLTINTSQAQPNQPIAVSLTVTNNGGTTGSYELRLLIDGIIRMVQEITLAPGSSEIVSFEVSDLAAGEHRLEVAGLTDQFGISGLSSAPAKPPMPAESPVPAKSTINWPLLGLITATVIVIGSVMLSVVKPEVVLTAARRLNLW